MFVSLGFQFSRRLLEQIACLDPVLLQCWSALLWMIVVQWLSISETFANTWQLSLGQTGTRIELSNTRKLLWYLMRCCHVQVVFHLCLPSKFTSVVFNLLDDSHDWMSMQHPWFISRLRYSFTFSQSLSCHTIYSHAIITYVRVLLARMIWLHLTSHAPSDNTIVDYAMMAWSPKGVWRSSHSGIDSDIQSGCNMCTVACESKCAHLAVAPALMSVTRLAQIIENATVVDSPSVLCPQCVEWAVLTEHMHVHVQQQRADIC